MFFTIFLISLAISANARVVDNAVKTKGRSVCMTEECREFASKIKESMDDSVDPCVDFYEYACGNWPKRNPIPTGNTVWKYLAVASKENRRRIEAMLETVSQEDEIPPVKIVKKWYKACVDTENMEKRGMEPLLSALNRIGGWPIITRQNEWNESTYKWQAIDDYYAQLKGSNLLHSVRVAIYGANATELSVVLDVPDLPLATWLLNSEVIEDEESEESNEDSNSQELINDRKKFDKGGKYWNFIVTIVKAMARAAGVNIPMEKLDKDIEDILNFQWKLDKLTYLGDEKEEMTIESFQKWYDNLRSHGAKTKVDWVGKIINMFKLAKVDMDVNTKMQVVSPEYFKKLVLLLDGTPSRIIANYLHWNIVSNKISKTTEEMRQLVETITSNKDEDEEEEEYNRSEACIEEAKMNDVIAYEYIRLFFSDETLRMGLDAMDNIQKEIESDIENSNWADDELKEFALRKLRTIKRNFGYPEWYRNTTFMKSYLDGLHLQSEYFENSVILQKYYTLKELRKIKYKEEVEPWIVDPLTINAFYLSKGNMITVPAANLQKPFFSNAQPDTINYALTGYLLAHEMYHPFDEQRHGLNEHNNEIEWSQEMTEKYNRSLECFVQQFDNYTLDGKPNGPKVERYGNQTLDENMSDTMGLRAAFKAFKQLEKMNDKLNPVLPGLEIFDNDQLYFLSFANLWCENIKPDYLVTNAKLDMHSTGRLRAIGSLSNSKDFAKAFNCPLGSPMNPEIKCNLWKH